MAREWFPPMLAAITFVVTAWALPAWTLWQGDPSRWGPDARGLSFGLGLFVALFAYAFSRIDQE